MVVLAKEGMAYVSIIIYDLEFTVVRKQEQWAEIIEIGAVKVAQVEEKLQIVDRFHSFVKPSFQPKLSPHTIQFTGIQQEDVSGAPSFSQAAAAFVSWIGNAPYYLCSWGPDDRLKLFSHCQKHDVDPAWIRNHNDLQKQLSRQIDRDVFRQVGLKKALEVSGIAFEGQHHRALDDAVNTAELYLLRHAEFTLETNEASDWSSYTTEVVYSTAPPEVESPFAKLAKLMQLDAE